VLFGHDELDLVLGTNRHMQAAEVNSLLGGVRLRSVPRASLRTRCSRGLRTGRLVIERLILELVAELSRCHVLRLPGVVLARVC
jgi:hypothetical protein